VIAAILLTVCGDVVVVQSVRDAGRDRSGGVSFSSSASFFTVSSPVIFDTVRLFGTGTVDNVTMRVRDIFSTDLKVWSLGNINLADAGSTFTLGGYTLDPNQNFTFQIDGTTRNSSTIYGGSNAWTNVQNASFAFGELSPGVYGNQSNTGQFSPLQYQLGASVPEPGTFIMGAILCCLAFVYWRLAN